MSRDVLTQIGRIDQDGRANNQNGPDLRIAVKKFSCRIVCSYFLSYFIHIEENQYQACEMESCDFLF